MNRQKIMFLTTLFLFAAGVRAQGITTEPAQQEEAPPGVQILQEPSFDGHQQRYSIQLKPTDPYQFALRTNLLYWAVGTTHLGVEWRPMRGLGVLLNGAFSDWSWKDRARRHHLRLINPEVRFYGGVYKRYYVGGAFHAGAFNIKLDEKGRKGHFTGGGISGGYQFRLNRSLDLDLNLGLGYTHFSYDRYTHQNGQNLWEATGLSRKFWGPTQLGATLVWKLVK